MTLYRQIPYHHTGVLTMTQQTLDAETVLAHASDGTQLVVNKTLERAPEDAPHQFDVSDAQLNSLHGLVRYPAGSRLEEVGFEKFSDARVAFGLWQRCGPYERSVAPAVPPVVATDDKKAITAHLYLNGGDPRPHSEVAELCEVSEQTVYDRLASIRWQRL
jgi:hypothetical protein